MRLNVLFIAPAAQVLGGTQTWLDYLLPGLTGAGCRVTLGLTAGRFHDVDEYLLHHPFAKSIRIHAPTGTREGRVKALAQAIDRESPDLVVVLNVVDVYEAVARLRNEQNRPIKVVATLHGLQPDFLQDFTAFAAHLDAVICSNRLAQALVRERCTLPDERVLYAPYGVQLPTPRPEVARAHSDPLRLAWVGRFESHQKRVLELPAILAQAVRSGIDVTLDIAGGGPQEDTLRHAFAAAGVDDQMAFLGVLDAAALRDQLYRRCDVLLLTSSWETGPIVAWEALGEGMAMLSSDYLGRRAEGSLHDNENCLLFAVGDIDGAVRGIAKLADPQLRARLAIAGRALVEHRYSQVQSIGTWLECLHTVHHAPALAHAPLPQVETSGRLDRALGARRGERVRELLGRRYPHTESGGEWPHTRGDLSEDDTDFWSWARAVDAKASAHKNNNRNRDE
ncbi:MAG: glycosyltransferase involved in cell wall biosynthesis [Gammaproteobacteria bacterium]|jgi:glycosyltransferase involved in cell wall biosynthesis